MVGIVVLDFNNAQDTINCIESVVKYTSIGSYKLFLVENGSNSQTVKTICNYISKNIPFVKLIISETNDGYAQGNNKALSLIDKDDTIDYVMILNNDILFTEDIVKPLVRYAQTLSDCGIISPLLMKRGGGDIDVNCARLDYTKWQFFFQYLFLFSDVCGILGKYNLKQRILVQNPEYLKKDAFEIEMPSGSCMLLKKKIFKQIGYFDPRTFLYFEENILYRKIKRIKMKNYLIPSLKCIHLGAATLGKRETSSYFANKCHMESNIYYLKEYCNAPMLSLFVAFMSKIVLLKILLQERFKK